MDHARKQGLIGQTPYISKKYETARDFSKKEEVIHAVTHGAAALLAVPALVLLLLRAAPLGALAVVAAAIYGASLIILYSASCAYHAACARFGEHQASPVRDFFMKCDHSMIFLLIVGTYAPACLAAMGGAIGWVIFGIVAACCLLGITLNIIDVARFHKLSLVLYILTGWAIIVAAVPLFRAIGGIGFALIVLGGVLYTVGVIFFKMERVPYMHVLWHLFVIGGSLLHYIAVYLYCFFETVML